MSAPPLSSLDPDWSTPPPASDPCPDPIGLDGLPLSVEQERLFFLEQLEPGTATYNVPLALRLSGPWRVHVLEAALNKIVARHESLRTNFVSVDGRPTQLIHPHRSLAMTFCSHPGEPEADGPGGMTEALVRAARKPFDLAKDLLIRAVLFQLRTDDHVLLLTVHHLVCDEWSMHLLGAELIQLATAFAAGQDSPFPELQVQYGDYAVWQREQLASDAIRGQLAYWKTQLQHGPTRLDLPTDRRPSERRSDEGRCYERLLPDQLGQALEGLAQREGVTPFMTLLASFHAFLGRYVGQDDIIVGTPVAGRSRLETEDIIGFFVNMLPLRANLGGDPNFLELLRRTRQTTLDAYANADVPFHRLVEELQPARRQGRTPLVQVVFAFEQPSLPPMSSPGLGIELLDVHTGTAKFDLTWVVRQAKGRCQLCIEYPIDLFDEPTIGHMAAAWQLLLEGMLAAPERPIARIPMLSAAARARAVSEWNRTDRPYPADSTIPALFEQQVAQHPNALALQYGERKYSYGELNQRANGVALALRNAGAGPGTMVAIWAERSIETIVGLLGILKAGCIYVPVDPASPPDRVRFILAETEAPLLLRCGPLLSPVEASIKILALDTLPDGPENLPKPAHPSPLAYVMYTSGSTGRPRGVLIEQRGVIRLVCNSNYLTWTRADRVAQLSNLCFDAATFEIWGALLNGAALIGIDHDLLLSPQRLALELRGEQVTTLFVTTALFNQIAAEHPGAFKGIKNVLFGGEAVDPKWVSRVLGGDAPERLLHVYGPTEATTFSSWHPITAVPIEATTLPIGRPIANTTLYLVDRWLEPVPIGVPGEICVGGPGVARGYLKDDPLTAEKFVPDPFAAQPGARLYKTGDLGRYRADGSVEFIGRVDNQLKIRGFRVELGEIESVLVAHPDVQEGVVLVDGADAVGSKRLVAFAVLKEGKEADLRSFLQSRLPDYMMPRQVVSLPKLPLNRNGKVDRAQLLQTDRPRTDFPDTYVAARTPIEAKLVAIWRDILGLDQVGIHDHYFDLGGHSLLAIRLFAAVEREFGRTLPLAALFRHPTIAKLAELLIDTDSSADWPLLVDIQAAGSKPPIFWVHSLGGDGGGAFFYYRKLAELLGPDQPCFGIRSPQEPFTSVAAMATRYVDELIVRQPEGPYFLGGFCFGGLVAFQMAAELEKRGRTVGLLALLESSPPTGRESKLSWRPEQLRSMVANMHSWLSDFLQQSPSELRTRLQRKSKSIQKRLQQKFGHAETHPPKPDLNDLIDMSAYPKDYVRYAQAHWQALLDFRPPSYKGRVTLFRARKQPLFSIDPTLGWDGLAQGGVAVNVIPGTHDTMMEQPNVAILAAELRACLAEAQAGLPLAAAPPIDEPAARSKTSAPPCPIIT